MSKPQRSHLRNTVAGRAPSIEVPFKRSDEGWSAHISAIDLLVIESSVPKLRAAIRSCLEEAVSNKQFKVRVETKKRGSQRYFSVIASAPKLLRKVIEARKRQFDARVKVIKPGPRDALSISLDYDLSPLKAFPVLLYIPDKSHHDHEHIRLTISEARALRDWLIKFLPPQSQRTSNVSQKRKAKESR